MTASSAAVDSVLYSQIESFYAAQIQLLGDGSLERWAETFTPDAIFEQDGRLEPDGTRGPRTTWRGRAEIVAAVRAAMRHRADVSLVRRYWAGMLTVEPANADHLRTGFYGALFHISPAGTGVFRSTYGTDLLMPYGRDWLVAHRRIDHDDVGRAERT